jgi:hypothetical protein
MASITLLVRGCGDLSTGNRGVEDWNAICGLLSHINSVSDFELLFSICFSMYDMLILNIRVQIPHLICLLSRCLILL